MISRVIPSPTEHDNEHLISSFSRSLFVTSPKSLSIRRKIRVFTGCLLGVWALVAFGWVWFARALDFKIGEWTFNFWMAAQGSLLVYGLIIAYYAWAMNRLDREHGVQEPTE